MQKSIISLSVYLGCFVFQCNGVSLRRQLQHIAKTRLESRGFFNSVMPSRRYEFDPRELTQILGTPNRPSHLPEAEAILPGHTLNRPALGMLKSSVKFPHKELEDGAGVYGSIDNLGIKYDSRNERLLYTGFRRFPSDYIMVIPSTASDNLKPSFKVESTVLDLEKKDTIKNQLMKVIKKVTNSQNKGNVRVYFGDLNNNYLNDLRTSEEVDRESYKWNKYLDEDEDPYLKKSALRTAEDAEGRQREAPTDADQDAKSKKIQWLYNTKNNYNHIKINQEAPELNELVPSINNNNIRQWWFYNADDYKQFS